MKKIKLILVGYGPRGKNWLQIIKKNKKTEIIAVSKDIIKKLAENTIIQCRLIQHFIQIIKKLFKRTIIMLNNKNKNQEEKELYFLKSYNRFKDIALFLNENVKKFE